jgi:hypothetical protein
MAAGAAARPRSRNLRQQGAGVADVGGCLAAVDCREERLQRAAGALGEDALFVETGHAPALRQNAH